MPLMLHLLHLLQILCAAEGHLLKRQELFDKLWPRGQEVSDASLSQLVWRLRGASGPYGELVAMVRRSGLRLDAAVSTELDFQRAPRGIAASLFICGGVARCAACASLDPAGCELE